MKQPLTDVQIQQIKNIVSQYPEIIAGYIFGSQITGKAHLKSDLDLGFICSTLKNVDILSLQVKISKLIKVVETDISILDENNRPLILMEIINGKKIYEKNPTDRINMETRILHRLEDYLHLQQINQYYINQSFTQGVYANK